MSSKIKPFAIGAFLLFLALPLITSNRNNSDLEKEDFFSVRSSDFSNSPKETPFNRYMERLKKFYNFGDKPSRNKRNTDEIIPNQPSGKKSSLLAKVKNITGNNVEADIDMQTIPESKNILTALNHNTEGINIEHAASAQTSKKIFPHINNIYDISDSGTNSTSFGGGFEDDALLFSNEKNEYLDSSFINAVDYNTNNNGNQNPVNLEDGTVLTDDNFLLYPTQEGYFYNGKFFKNGYYPRFANRDYVEGALNSYHSKVASKLGKKAIYLQDDKGNLTVSYVNQLPNKFNFNKSSHTENTLVASSKMRDSFGKYSGARINGKNNVIGRDIAGASLQDMHDAYELLKSQIQSGTLTSDYRFNLPSNSNNTNNSNSTDEDNSSVKEFLRNAGGANLNLTNQPNNTAPIDVNPDDSLTIVMGGRDFADNYAYGIHDLGCSTGEIFSHDELQEYHIREQMEADPLISIVLGTCAPPLSITPSPNINSHIAQDADMETLRAKISNSVAKSDKTAVRVVTTDRTTAPMLDLLNEEQSIKNKDGKPVTLVAVGPKEGVSNLATAMEEITKSVIGGKNDADELNNTISQFYLTTQLKPTNTILAFPTASDEVFVVNDPNNNYWIKAPKEVNKYDKTYLLKNGVYYQGAMIKTDDVMDILEKDRTNLLLVSDREGQRVLDNGSVLVTVKEEAINMNSYDPQTIIHNTEFAQKVTKLGDKARKAKESKYGISIANIAKKHREKRRAEKRNTPQPTLTPSKDSKPKFGGGKTSIIQPRIGNK